MPRLRRRVRRLVGSGEEGAQFVVARLGIPSTQLDELSRETAVKEQVRQEIRFSLTLSLSDPSERTTEEPGISIREPGRSHVVGREGSDVFGGAYVHGAERADPAGSVARQLS